MTGLELVPENEMFGAEEDFLRVGSRYVASMKYVNKGDE